MTLYQGAIATALLLDLILGVAVYLPNRRRPVNLIFALLSLAVAAWSAANIGILQATEAVWAGRFVQASAAAAAFTPTFCQMLRMAVADRQLSAADLVRRSGPMLILTVLLAAACCSPFFVQDVRMPRPGSGEVVEPRYGALFSLYAAYFVTHVAALFVLGRRDRARVDGSRRVELDYILFGVTAALALGTALGIGLTLATGSSRAVPVANAMSVGVLVSIIAYGIATRRIMGVAEMLRRIVAYSLLALALAVVYLAVLAGSSVLMARFAVEDHDIQHVAAAVAVAILLRPLRRRLMQLSERWMGDEDRAEVSEFIDQTVRDLLAVRTVEELMREFVGKAKASVGAERALLLLRTDGRFAQVEPAPPASPLSLREDDPLPRMMASSPSPIPLYTLERSRPTQATVDAAHRMDEIGAQMVAGIFSPDRLEGMLVLGRRRSGGVYSPREQDRIRHLCGQFSLSLSNARLYTEVQDGRRYNETLLDCLASGVVACDAQRRMTVINREACRLLGLDPAGTVGVAIEALPESVALPMADALENGRTRRDFDMHVAAAGGSTLRGSSSLVTGHRGRPLGALLVFNDVTALVRLEARVRRSDRLASVGTIAAGMAHEIKNPLVTLKTFVQLLPRSFDDEDFRTTFTPLVESEVNRIDQVVNQLLNFARPAAPTLEPVHMHEVLDRTLNLVGIQYRNRGLTVNRSFEAASDVVEADKSLLEQVFVNLYFNAMDAMQPGGRLTVTTRIAESASGERDLWGVPILRLRLCVSVGDTGHGIAPEHLPHIFDPFYTTKADGWGLGLSIAHGIVKQHGGAMDVESESGRGTVFSVLLPLLGAPGGRAA